MRRLRIVSFPSPPAVACGALVCALSALYLVSCSPPASYVDHYAELTKPPDLACVVEQLHAIATDRKVQTIDDPSSEGVNHRFVFDAGGVPHHLGIFFRADHSASMRHTAWAPHLKLAELQAARRSLGAVEKELADRCGGIDHDSVVQETCHGKNCDQLEPTRPALARADPATLRGKIDAAEAKWQGASPRQYKFTFGYGAKVSYVGCESRTFEVHVRDSVPASFSDCGSLKDQFGTVPSLFRFLRGVLARNPDAMEVSFDPTLGYPQKLQVDFSSSADGYFFFEVDRFAVEN